MNYTVTLCDDESVASTAASMIETQLLASLREELEQATNTAFVLAATNDEGRLVGGLTASTSYGWLLIKTLWVDSRERGQGLGTILMQRAEEAGRGLACHSVWLDTSHPGARVFYEKQGYRVFGELSNSEKRPPATHHRWFMQKTIASDTEM